MKKLILLATLCITISVSAQFSFGYYGLHNLITPFKNGWGFEMNGLTSPLKTFSGMETFPVKFQIGAGYSYLAAGNKNFKNVVLEDGADPVNVSFTNSIFTVQGTMRISVPSASGKYIPYGEFSPGLRLSNSSIDIYANDDDNSSSHQPDATNSLNLSYKAGLQIQLNKSFAVDCGVALNSSNNPGTMIATTTANVRDGISYSMVAAPNSIAVFQFGVRVNLSKNGCCDFPGCEIPSHHKSCGETHVKQ